MSEPDAVPLPREGEVFFDVRGESRTMRLSWYADSSVAVFSIWQGNRCTSTFRLPFGDLARMVEALQAGPPSREPDRHQGEPAYANADSDPGYGYPEPPGYGDQASYAGAPGYGSGPHYATGPATATNRLRTALPQRRAASITATTSAQRPDTAIAPVTAMAIRTSTTPRATFPTSRLPCRTSLIIRAQQPARRARGQQPARRARGQQPARRARTVLAMTNPAATLSRPDTPSGPVTLRHLNTAGRPITLSHLNMPGLAAMPTRRTGVTRNSSNIAASRTPSTAVRLSSSPRPRGRTGLIRKARRHGPGEKTSLTPRARTPPADLRARQRPSRPRRIGVLPPLPIGRADPALERARHQNPRRGRRLS